MRTALALPILLLALPAQAKPTMVTPGQVYPAGTHVGFEELGISFRLPKAFKGALRDEVFLMASDQERGMILGIADTGVSMTDMIQQMSQPIPLDSTVLQPVGQPTRGRGKTVSSKYTATVGDQVLAGRARARLLKDGTAVAFISIAPSAKSAQQRLDAIFRSLRQMPKPKPGQSSGQWANKLRGNTLTYMKTGNGLSTKRHIQLCPNGQFTYYSSESYLSGSFSGVGQGNNRGTYVIRGNALVLTWANGNVDRRSLSTKNGKTFVNGVRWFVQSGTDC
ncbi:MAG: hypothetical protein AAFN74_07295 [Myxococcota bacterium]